MSNVLGRGLGVVMVALCLGGCPKEDEGDETAADGGGVQTADSGAGQGEAGKGEAGKDAQDAGGTKEDSAVAEADAGGGGGGGDVFTCSNPATMYCQTSTVGKSGIDNREMSCTAAGGTGVEACPTEGCVGICKTEFDGGEYGSYAYSGTVADQKNACEVQGGTFQEGC